MDRLSTLLPKILRQRGLHEPFSAGLVVLRAQEWIGAHLPQHAATLRVTTFVDGVLSIDAHHSIALHECQMASPQLQSALSRLSDGITVTEVRVRRV